MMMMLNIRLQIILINMYFIYYMYYYLCLLYILCVSVACFCVCYVVLNKDLLKKKYIYISCVHNSTRPLLINSNMLHQHIYKTNILFSTNHAPML